ncbi:MAG: hypothetical protein ACF8GE_10175 [Phycisphaerales bacterium JB043]
MQEIIHSLWFGLACLAALGAVLTLLLRAARIPGGTPAASIAAGIISGTLLGATVLGNVNPDLHMYWFIGGVEESRAITELLRQHERDLVALDASGVSPEGTSELMLEQLNEQAEYRTVRTQAQKHHELLLTRASLALLVAMVLAVAFHYQKPITRLPVVSRLLAALLAGVTTGISCLILVTALKPQFQFLGIPYSVKTSFFVLAGVCACTNFRIFQAHQRRSSSILWLICVPTLTALCFTHISLVDDIDALSFVLIFLAVAIASHDGRWLGAWLGIRMFGNEKLHSAQWQSSGKILDEGAGAAQASLAGFLAGIGFLSPTLGATLILSALIIELCQPIRQPVARWMDEQFSPQPDPE